MKNENKNIASESNRPTSIADELLKTFPYEFAKRAADEIVKRYRITKRGGRGNGDAPILYLNMVGDLWREPKSKYLYRMGEKSDRYSIVRYLSQNSGYHRTSDISDALDGKNEKSIRNEIGKIKGNVKKFLKIDANDFIQSRKGSGYRVNPKYKVNLKNG